MARMSKMLTTMRRAVFLSLLLASATLHLHPATARAQATSDTTCSYSRCALRINYGFFSTRLVRGSTGESVSRLGCFGSGVGLLIAAPDSAAYYARQYQSRRSTSDLLGLVGGALVVV